MSSTNFTIYSPGFGTLSYSLTSSGENSVFAHFAAALVNHYNLAISFHHVPISAEWTAVAWYDRVAQYLYIWPTIVTWTPVPTYMPISVVNDSKGDKVPLVRIIERTPAAWSSSMVWPGLKHQ